MKVLFLSSGLSHQYGGSAISEASLASGLQRHAEVQVLCRRDRWEAAFGGGHGLKDVTLFSPLDVLKAVFNGRHWLNKLFLNADVFHLNGHWRWENYFFTVLCRRKAIPYVMHPRGMFLLGHRKVALKRVFNFLIGNRMARNAAKVIALSQYEVGQFGPYLISKGKVAVVPNGIRPPQRASDRTASKEGPYFLYLGRLEARKNLLFLIDAFASYRQSGGQCRLFFVGPVEKGYDKAIHARTEVLKQGAYIQQFPPAYDQKKWEYLSGAKALIYPTVDEPFGRVPFEAIASGTHPIVPDESGSAEYLSKFIPYCIYKHQDEASLVATLHGVERAGETQGFGEAHAWVERELDWTRITGRVADIYREIREPLRFKRTG